ncbi:MAG TPA: hypothetical protein ENN19_11570 [Chloroflexi bacterium]|nr:hypothetical protein [Chloroflexota bacterium]
MKIRRSKPQHTKQALAWLAVTLLLFIFGLLVADHARQIRFRQTMTTLYQTIVDKIAYAVAVNPDLPTLTIDVRPKRYEVLLDQRARALRDAVFIPSEEDFVSATARVAKASVPIEMRLSGGPARNLGNEDKWGFEIRTELGQQLFEIRRPDAPDGLCSLDLLDPALNNGLAQWAFLQALEREGVLVARYRFVRLILNGRDRGVYALRENVSCEPLIASDWSEGVILHFDTHLLWKSLSHFQGDLQAVYADPATNLSAFDFQYFEIDAFRDATLAGEDDGSAQLREQNERAVGMLRALQAGESRASEVFDVALYGRFLALADLWDATEAVSLVNLRYYYNPTSDRLEPLAFDAAPLRGNERVSLATTYGDPALQAAYVREAARLSQPDYVNWLSEELAADLLRLQRAMGGQYGRAGEMWEQLRARQAQMRRSLDPVQPVFAYLGPPELTASGAVQIDVGNALNFPVEVVGFDVNGTTFLPARRYWLSSESVDLLVAEDGVDGVVLRASDPDRVPVLRYVRFDVPLAEIHRLNSEHDFTREMDVRVVTRILGLEEVKTTPARHGYPDVFVVPASLSNGGGGN